MTAPDIQAAFCATLVDEWARAGVTDAVVAPGSRSTPMVLALACDERIRLHVVLDERSAGFVALGLGLCTRRPAPVVTTSGTAAVELHPAVVEAHQAGVPMLAVTADRPPELHHVGAPQTIEQEGLFGVAVRWSVSPGVADPGAASSWRSLGARGGGGSAGTPAPGRSGPVHLNLAFREPLLGEPAGRLPTGRAGGQPWHVASGPGWQALDGPLVERLAGAAGGQGLIIAGDGAGEPDAVLALGHSLGWPVLADPRSGCRVPDPIVVGAADALLRAEPPAGWCPEYVLRLGRPWASKVVGQWLAGLDGVALDALVDPSGTWADPDRRAQLVSATDPTALARAVAATAGRSEAGPTAWLERWQAAEAAAQAAIDEVLAAEPGVTEAGLARALVGAVAEGSTLLASSSMPIRDVEWFGPPRRGVRLLANRGANGIDGVISTTLGVALGGMPGVVGLIGDLAFLYDAGALLWSRDRPVDCTLVVVDNNGGGIFSFLPQAAALPAGLFERLWGTPHGLDVEAVATAYGVPAVSLSRLDDLPSALRTPEAPGLRVVVARTDRAANVAAHDRLNAAVAAAVAKL